MFVRRFPTGIEVVAETNVLPLQQNRSAEIKRGGWPADDHARPVGMSGIDDASGSQIGRAIAIGEAFEEEFLFDVPVSGEIYVRGEERVIVGGVARRRGRQDGPITFGLGTTAPAACAPMEAAANAAIPIAFRFRGDIFRSSWKIFAGYAKGK